MKQNTEEEDLPSAASLQEIAVISNQKGEGGGELEAVKASRTKVDFLPFVQRLRL